MSWQGISGLNTNLVVICNDSNRTVSSGFRSQADGRVHALCCAICTECTSVRNLPEVLYDMYGMGISS